jgi:hypothetical protein
VYCWYSQTSPFFLLLAEHRHCDNVATNLSSNNAGSRMVTSLWGSVGTGTKQDKSSTGCIWAAGFHHVTPHSCLVHFETYEPFVYLIFQLFSIHGKQQITETMNTESVDMGVHMYIFLCIECLW